MNHKKNTQKFKRTTEERKRLWIDLASALILNGQITTFTTRAKWFSPKFQRLVTLVKRAGDDKQLAFKKVRPFLSEKVARKLIEEVTPKLQERNGGYVSIIKFAQPFNEHDKSIVTIVS
ncbi:MAG: bL17 family ribosomal protein [Patescibacteria group bacterium]